MSFFQVRESSGVGAECFTAPLRGVARGEFTGKLLG